jgi:hypothetical protein
MFNSHHESNAGNQENEEIENVKTSDDDPSQ